MLLLICGGLMKIIKLISSGLFLGAIIIGIFDCFGSIRCFYGGGEFPMRALCSCRRVIQYIQLGISNGKRVNSQTTIRDQDLQILIG